jgi:hypothetical protein
MEPPLKLGCYTSPRSWNGMCGPPGEAATGFGYEAVDMNFFAEIGCDHVMVDEPDGEPSAFRSRYKLLGDAIADSSNPNMVFGVWCSPTHPWKWAAEVGGNYWRLAGDIYDSWSAVLRQWDVAYSIPNIDRFTKPGRYSFLDQMVVGDVPNRSGSAYGPGLSHDQTVAHMSMWVMAASPLLTCTDVRNMSAATKEILTNPEVLAVHKDRLARMAVRVDVGGGGGLQELRSANLCAASWRGGACQEGPGDPGYGEPCATCRSNWSVFEKPLHDNSSAVMVLNRGEQPVEITVDLSDLADSRQATWAVRDLWSKTDLGVCAELMPLTVPGHGVRLLRMRPHAPAPTVPCRTSPAPNFTCPSGFAHHEPRDGLWANPIPGDGRGDRTNNTMALCARKCSLAEGCAAFELWQLLPKACYIFMGELRKFTANRDCHACVKRKTDDELLIDTSARGLAFEGIGGLNGGNGGRLLANYPRPQRDAVLDLLFSPSAEGLALDILKVCHYMIQPLVGMYGGFMVVLKVS